MLRADEIQALYERFAPVVHRRCVHLLGRDSDAWDQVQAVFMKLLEDPGGFREEARPMTYIYRVATNVCLNHLRGRALRERPEPLPHAWDMLEPGAVEARDFIRALVGRLDERSLVIATLYYLDGLKQEEVAEVVGISRKWVGRELARIRKVAVQLEAEP